MSLARTLEDSRLLDLWDRGRNRHPVDRGVLMLGAAFPGTPYEQLADLSVGARDAALLGLRRALFGGRLDAFVSCPQCDERLEFALDSELLTGAPPAADASVQAGDYRFRMPTSRDLAVAVGDREPDRVARKLAELCLLQADGDLPPPDWSEALLDDVEAGMSLADPQGDLQAAVTCAACGHAWSEPFDIAQFLWEEIEARAIRLLHDVDALARSYGWTEPEVLALGPARRAAYIDLATA
jgi:hypothetical protein